MNQFPRSIAVIEADLAAGRSLGVQLFVARGDEVLIDEAFGQAAPGVALRRDSLMPWLSCSKPVTAVAVAQQWEAGRLDLDEPVATYLPAFASGGKERVTIRHLLTHTAGFARSRYHFPGDDWDTIIAKVCAAPLEDGWPLGERARYRAGASWFILGELVRRASGQALSQYVRERVFLPLGMGDCHLGIFPEAFDALADRVSPVWDVRGDEPRELIYGKRRRLTECSPGGGAVGPADQLGRSYGAMRGGGRGVLQPATVELFTARHREGLHDHAFHQTVDWGLGFIRDSKRHGKLVVPYGFGAHASDATFGHGGHQTSLAFADPATGLAVTFIFNGMPGEHAHQQRSHDLATAIYEDAVGSSA